MFMVVNHVRTTYFGHVSAQNVAETQGYLLSGRGCKIADEKA
jgi:hypothetical protein